MTEVIMVHGTWSNRKIWESPFARELAKLLHVTTGIQPFEWSGRNSVTAREDASTDFIAFVNERASKDSSVRRVVVCHSHGGSIVMRALAREPKLPIDALVCIGTPFLHVSRLEEVVPGAIPPFKLAAAAIGIIFVLAFARVMEFFGFAGLHHAVTWMWSHPLRVLAGLAIAFIGLVLFAIVMLWREWAEDRRLGRNDFESTEEYVDGLLKEPADEVWALKQRCRLPTSEPVPTLLIRTPGDEAQGLLGAAQMASYVARTLYDAPLRILGKTWLRHDPEDVGFLEFPIYAVLWSAAFTWRAFVSIPIVAITALTFLPFGIEFSRLAGRVLVASGDAPPGSWTVTYLPPFDRYEERVLKNDAYVKARNKDDGTAVERMENDLTSEWKLATRGIAHSRAYNDLRSARVIATWLDAQMKSIGTAAVIGKS